MTGSTSTAANILGKSARAGLIALAAVSLAACGGGKGRPKADLAASKITTIGVNSYLWRASLEALSFMPLLQTDSNGRVRPGQPADAADALRVAASRQTLTGGVWVDAPVQAATTQKLEDVILTRARDLRRQASSGD